MIDLLALMEMIYQSKGWRTISTIFIIALLTPIVLSTSDYGRTNNKNIAIANQKTYELSENQLRAYPSRRLAA